MRIDLDQDAEVIAEEHFFGGVGVSAGFAIGTIHLIETGLGQVPEYQIAAESVDGEIARFTRALSRAKRQVTKLKQKSGALAGATAEELGLLLDAHAAMLGSTRMIQSVERNIRERRINAEAAVQEMVQEITRGFARVKDPYLAARLQDIRDVGSRILRQLTKTPYQAFSVLPAGAVVVADELSPADIALMDPTKIAAFVTALGGAEGHTAIMARSMGIPAVLGTPGLLAVARSGQSVIVDGDAGRIVCNPNEATLAEYRRRAEARVRLNRQLARLRTLPAHTRDGTTVGMQANIELARDVQGALNAGAEGIGLLRTEFMFMNRDNSPGEEEQYALLRTVVEGMKGRPVTIRTLDVGGEKLTSALGDSAHHSANPMLGLRAIRFSLKEPKLFEVQLAAILRAGAHGPVRLLLPMISSVHQVRQVTSILKRLAARLRRRNVAIADPLPPLGAMIEVPGAALISDSLAQEVDFFAIGTNDLTMYTLAIDRGDEQVAGLYNPLHPAVLRLIQFTIGAAQRAGKPVSICGEIAGDPRFAPLLVGLGVRDLSMASQSIPRVKQRIRALDTGPATRRALAIMDQADEGRVTALLDDFNESL
ncbi:MAG: phosphoenolpyruvate--protein phosphotransferase [Alphaproteobacteria bacterium]|nr:phosphoenolpyruvate--protein phosphotransferase [Alphaproteobacteria bacterium]